MDNHTRIVSEARARAENAPPKAYFAYSTILDPHAFGEWKSAHGYDDFVLPPGELGEAIDLALVFDFPSRFWGGRVAGLSPAPGKRLWGRLFEIAGRDWPVIEHKEGAVTGMCVEKPVRVRLSDGRVIDAIAFTTAPARASTDGPISQGFVRALIGGAAAAQLPLDYLAELEQLKG